MKGISIIVCCYNSTSLLEPTLKHIAAQKLNDIPCELIIIDNASTDGTADLAKRLWTGLGNNEIALKIESEPQSGLSHARQKGIKSSSFDYLVFCDDDNWLDEHYASTAFELFETNPTVGVLGGNGTPEFENSVKPVWFDSFYHGFAVGPQGGEETFLNNVYGAGICIRKSVAEKVFEKGLLLSGRSGKNLMAGDDSEVCSRVRLLGYQVMYSPRLLFKHYLTQKRLSWDYVKKLHAGFAQGFVVLNLYEQALTGSPSKLPLFYWFKKAFYYRGIFFKYWPRHYRAYKNKEAAVEELHHIVWRIIGTSYLKYNFKTVAMYRQIMALKNKVTSE